MQIVDFDEIIEMFWDGNFMEIYKDDIPSIPSAFEGMTNGEVIKTLFPNLCSYDGEDYVLLDLSDFCGGKLEKKWWDAPYNAEREE